MLTYIQVDVKLLRLADLNMLKIKALKSKIKKTLKAVWNARVVKRFQVVRLRNVLVVPYEDLLDKPNGRTQHKGGPIWRNWRKNNMLRHRRLNFEDARPTTPKSVVVTENTPLLWCGAIVDHFGHQIADFTSRIPAYKMYLARHEKVKANFCFAVKYNSNITSVSDAPSYFRQILSWFDIPENKVKIVSKSIRAKTLLATPQLELLTHEGTVLDERYLSFLAAHVENKLGPLKKNNKTLYVSRSALQGGELAGEKYIEKFFSQQGVEVIHPQNFPLIDQIRMYREAKALIFLEGSALHVLQFLGRTPTSIHIMNRRPRSRLMADSLGSRFPIVEHFDLCKLIHGLTGVGRLSQWDGISILKKEAFYQFAKQMGFDLSKWDNTEFTQHEREQLKSWVARKDSENGDGKGASIDFITQKFIEAELDINDYR